MWADDNGPPTWAFLWAAGRRKGRDVQFDHVWPGADRPEVYTALWNLCATPAFLAKTTDTHPEVVAALRYRSYDLFGQLPPGASPPPRPPDYGALAWAPMPEPVPSLEGVLRRAMGSATRNSATLASRELGWLFSGWRPDSSL